MPLVRPVMVTGLVVVAGSKALQSPSSRWYGACSKASHAVASRHPLFHRPARWNPAFRRERNRMRPSQPAALGDRYRAHGPEIHPRSSPERYTFALSAYCQHSGLDSRRPTVLLGPRIEAVPASALGGGEGDGWIGGGRSARERGRSRGWRAGKDASASRCGIRRRVGELLPTQQPRLTRAAAWPARGCTKTRPGGLPPPKPRPVAPSPAWPRERRPAAALPSLV